MLLSRASYMQGTVNKSICGQSTVFGIQQIVKTKGHLNNISNTTKSTKINKFHMKESDDFSLAGYTAEQVWRYRRLIGKGLGIK